MTEDDSGTGGKHAIHAYVPAEIHSDFEAYRRELGLTSASALLTLLVLREIRLQRLSATPPGGDPGHAFAARDAKVSAYIDANKAEAFRAVCGGLGRSVSDGAADLIARELAERWLEAALQLPSMDEAAR